MTKTYHIFTDNRDEWLDYITPAIALFREWKKEYGTARLYEETVDEDGETITEDCIKSYGSWPW